MQFKKMKVIAYTMYKRLQGYNLLRNSEKSSPFELTMIRYGRDMTYTCDVQNRYDRIYRNFETKQKVHEFLVTVYFYSPTHDTAVAPYKSYTKVEKPTVRQSFKGDAFGGKMNSDINKFLELEDKRRSVYKPFQKPGFFDVLRNNLKTR